MTRAYDGTRVDESGTTVGPYRLIALLGRGGMGEVYRAHDARRGREVALKLLPVRSGGDAFRARFRREADVAAGLREPHIVPIHDFGEIDGRLFLDMRLIDGAGLDTVLRGGGPVSPLRAVHLLTQIAQALDAAHGQGLVHRDVKPSNILITPHDFPYLVDFGIARAVDDEHGMTTTGSAIGTAAYMAPERFDGGPPDRRSDVYSLACVLAECLLGRPPFEATSLPGQMKAHLLSEPPRPSTFRPDVPGALDGVIARGMEKDPSRRFATAGELVLAAGQALHGSTGATTPTVPAPRPAPTLQASIGADVDTRFAALRSDAKSRLAPPRERPRRRRRTTIAASIVGVVAVVGLIAFGAGRLTSDVATTPVAAPSSSPVIPNWTPVPTPTRTTSSLPQPTAAPVAMPSMPGVGHGSSSGYTYRIESNYPVYVGYTAENGDRINANSVTAPWTLSFSSDKWGADQRPSLSAFSMSSKGDTYVSCTISDANGKVLASDRKEMANAAAMCMVF